MAKWQDPGWSDRKVTETHPLQRAARVIAVGFILVVVVLFWLDWMRANDDKVLVPGNRATTSTLIVDCDRVDILCDDESS